MDITIETTVNASPGEVWRAWTTPADIMQWNFASEEWCCPKVEIDFCVGGNFNYRMESRDGSAGFDFEGKFTSIVDNQIIEYEITDGRKVRIDFTEVNQGTRVTEKFEAENQHSREQQRQGWLSILNNFKRHVEKTRG